MRVAIITLGWHAVTQRPHHWASCALRTGHDVSVFTIAPPLRGSFAASSFLGSRFRLKCLPKSLLEVVLFKLGRRATAKELLLKRFANFVGRLVLKNTGNEYDAVILATEPFPLDFKSQNSLIIYDCMDDWESFPGVQESVMHNEDLNAKSADLIVAVSKPLCEKLSQRFAESRIILIPNGCDYAHFSSVPRSRYDQTKLVIGYTGMVTEWFNWEVVLHLANSIPYAVISLVGPYKDLPENLPKNVELRGRRPYAQMPEHNSHCDVCIIPFRIDEKLVHSVSPIKLFEYLASGCPVVSSPMPDVCRLAEDGIVHVAETPEDFVREVLRAASLSWDAELSCKRKQIAADHSWDSRWRAMEDAMSAAGCKAFRSSSPS